MTSAALRLPTFEELYAEIEALPQGMTGEILGPGELRVMSRPASKHGFSSRRLARALSGADLVMGGTGWVIDVEREIHLPDDRLYVPDLAGWRVDEYPDFIRENPITVVPDWACEILSRTTQRADRALKVPVYARWGVAHIWVIDPAARSLEVYETQGGKPVMVETAVGDSGVRPPPFDLPIDLATLWEPPPRGAGRQG